MKGIIDWLLGRKAESSREAANKRMKLMVIHDRSQLPQEVLAQLKKELFDVISKYFEVDQAEADFMIESHEQFSSIVTNTPLKVKSDIRVEMVNGSKKSKESNKNKRSSKDLQSSAA